MVRLLLVALVSVGLTGCLYSPGGSLAMGPKTVDGKESPMTLVARDGTHCQVTPERFERTKIGDRVWCGWRNPGAAEHPGDAGKRGGVPVVR